MGRPIAHDDAAHLDVGVAFLPPGKQLSQGFLGTVKLVSGGPICCPVSASQTRTVLSALPETMRLPSGLNATLFTQSVSPVSGAPMGWPVSTFHSRMVLSQLPETTRRPSGLNATLSTKSVWPVSGAPICWPVFASHSRTACGW